MMMSQSAVIISSIMVRAEAYLLDPDERLLMRYGRVDDMKMMVMMDVLMMMMMMMPWMLYEQTKKGEYL